MAQPSSRMLARLKMGISIVGILILVAGAIWIWGARDLWPRAAGDPIKPPVLESLGLIITGLFLLAKSR